VTIASSTLRERSKVRRRAAIQRAALGLFAERGYDGTTLSDIATAAEVAIRTVSMYFPSKTDLALSASNEIAARLTATFEDDPAAGFFELIDRWLRREAELTDPELVTLTGAVFAANPALRALSSTSITEAMQVGGVALFAEIGLPPGDPMAAIVAASVGAAIWEYLTLCSLSEPSAALRESLLQHLRTMIDAVRGG
jgi:AcrR family transcriptional regulator